jgi:hypothetical protein
VSIVDGERPAHPDRDRLSSLLDLPAIRTARQAQVYASVLVQICSSAGDRSLNRAAPAAVGATSRTCCHA